MTLSLGSITGAASSLLTSLTGAASATTQTATPTDASTTQATTTTPAKVHHGGHHHHGGGTGTQNFGDILAALTNPTSTGTTSGSGTPT